MAGPLGSAPGIMVGVGVGTAAAAAIEPLIEPGKQAAWQAHANKVLDAGLLARLVAQGAIDLGSAQGLGARTGFGEDKINQLVHLALRAPGTSEGLALLRRKLISPSQFEHIMAKEQLEHQYWTAVEALQGTLLSPEVMAQGVQQGHVPNEDILPGLPTPTHIPAGYPAHTAPDGIPPTDVPLTTIQIDPITQSAGSGTSLDQLKVLANLAGLPPGAMELLHMWNRNLVTEDAVDAGLREGHLKTKWADAFKRLRWSVLSHIQYVDARVRGYITNAEMYQGGALHGFTSDQMDLLHKTHGRPPSWHQVWVGIQRGGVILSPTADLTPQNTGIDPTFFKALQQSDIQQQWYDIVWHLRWNYPSPFVLRQLSTGPGALTPADLTDVLTKLGWEPTFITKTVEKWTGGTAATSDPYIGKADTQLWTEIHKAYVKTGIARATAEQAMTVLVPTAADRATIFARWDEEKVLVATPTGG